MGSIGNTGNIRVSVAESADVNAILALFPRLASFEIPPGRNPLHLWTGDAEMLKAWGAGQNDGCMVTVAKDGAGQVVGAAMATLRSELLSQSPSAHLEALVVADAAEGQGVGKALLAAAEQEARERGALSMSLHVFAGNRRARHVYEKAGYDGELLRYIKTFEKGALG